MVLIKAFRKEDTMEKTIKLCNKEYKLKSSAYTQFAYRNETGRGLMSDLQELTKLNIDDIDNNNLEVIDTLNNMVLRMAYVMIKEADKTQVGSFEDFLRSLDHLYEDTEWINETIETAISPLSRG